MKLNKINIFILLLLIHLGISFEIQCLFSQDKAASWWLAAYNSGMEYLEKSEYDQAKLEFQKILEQDKNIAEAHYGLGIAADLIEPGSREAQNFFEKAIDLDKNFAQAYYGLGLVQWHMNNKEQDARKNLRIAVNLDGNLFDAWYVLGQVEENLQQIDPAMTAYKEALKLQSSNEKFYISFLEMTYRNTNASRVLNALNELKRIFPDNPEFDMALANVYFRLNDFALCSATLETMKKKFPDFPPSRIYLLQAKVGFEHQEISEALGFYWSAINTIQNEKDAQAVLDDVCYIMNNDEYDRLKETPIAEVWKFYYQFWKRRDPNFATKDNERLVEHYQRLLYAFKNYRRYITRDTGMKFVYASAHPFSQYNIMGDDFWAESFWPKAIPRNREIDDLGIIYIRHGEPDQKVTSLDGISIFEDPTRQPHWEEDPNAGRTENDPILDAPGITKETTRAPQPTKGERLTGKELRINMPQNLSWKYFDKGNRKEMIFHFEKHGGTLGWIIEAIPFVPAGRHEMHPELQELEETSYNPTVTPRARSVESSRFSNLIKADSKRFAKIALTTETTNYEQKEEKFEFPYQFLTFKGPNGQNLVEIYYMIEGYDTEIRRSDTGGILDLTKYVGFFDNKWDELVSLNRTDKINLPISTMEWKNVSVVDVERFNITPGNYNIEIQLRENTSNKLGVYKSNFTNVNYNVNQLMVSDVIVSDAIQPSELESKFSKTNIKYNPKMFSAFERASTVGIYFEIYNLAGNESLETNFRVSCTLRPFAASRGLVANKISAFFKNLRGEEQGTVGTSYDYQGKTRDEKLYLNFQLEENFSGRYELEIEVIDLNAQLRTVKRVPITITS